MSKSNQTHQRIDHILDGVKIPANRFCLRGDSFSTLQSVGDLMELLAAIDAAAASECEFEMPAIGPGMMNVLRDTVRDAVKYAAEVNDLHLTLRTHAEIGGLEKFIEIYGLDKEAAPASETTHQARIDEAMALSKAAEVADRRAAQEVAHV
jgi:hypothetical protein